MSNVFGWRQPKTLDIFLKLSEKTVCHCEGRFPEFVKLFLCVSVSVRCIAGGGAREERVKFVDEVKITVKGGDGGRGCMSFRREKFVPRGGPDGGNGGDGGDVVVVGDAQISTLLDLRYQRLYRAGRGEHGRGKDQHGRRGAARIIAVPLGTVIRDLATKETLADIRIDQERFVVAAGGKGGRGNATFATSTNRAPRHAQPGLPGEEKELVFELKLLADVGLIGKPNAGKSTLISVISAARPKIADYPFTTVVPNLGVVRYGDDGSFVVADIPGLIEGAHRGEGLGHRFLRHVSRTRLLVHLLDAGGPEGGDPRENFNAINRELEYFDETLARKPQIVVATKIDLLGRGESLSELEAFFKERSYAFCSISAVTGKGLEELKALIVRQLGETLTEKSGKRKAESGQKKLKTES